MVDITKLPDPTGTITLTKTMLDKCIIDANASVRKLALYLGVDYSKMDAGDKETVDARIFGADECKITFYKAKTRGDRRVSISKLKKAASEGDTVALTILNGVVVVNLTRDADRFSEVLEVLGG